MFYNAGAVDQLINTVGQTVSFYPTPGSEAGKVDIVAAITRADETTWALLKAGLRPNIDIAADIPSGSTVLAGYEAVYDGERYQVRAVDKVADAAGAVVSLRALLVAKGPSGVDLG